MTREQVVQLLEEMVLREQGKLVALARRLRPSATEEDLLQPHDIPELRDDPDFHYQDGLVAGLLAALTALRCVSGED